MELIDDLNQAKWTKIPDGSTPDFVAYTILQKKMVKPGVFKYAIEEVENQNSEMFFATLEDAAGKRDPLGSVRNCEFVISDDKIQAVNIDAHLTMELMDELNQEKWEKITGDPPAFVTYVVIQKRMVEPGVFRYALEEKENPHAELFFGVIEDAAGETDPLGSVLNVDFIVDEEKKITAICIEGDMARRKS